MAVFFLGELCWWSCGVAIGHYVSEWLGALHAPDLAKWSRLICCVDTRSLLRENGCGFRFRSLVEEVVCSVLESSLSDLVLETKPTVLQGHGLYCMLFRERQTFPLTIDFFIWHFWGTVTARVITWWKHVPTALHLRFIKVDQSSLINLITESIHLHTWLVICSGFLVPVTQSLANVPTFTSGKLKQVLWGRVYIRLAACTQQLTSESWCRKLFDLFIRSGLIRNGTAILKQTELCLLRWTLPT